MGLSPTLLSLLSNTLLSQRFLPPEVRESSAASASGP